MSDVKPRRNTNKSTRNYSYLRKTPTNVTTICATLSVAPRIGNLPANLWSTSLELLIEQFVMIQIATRIKI